MKGRAQRPALFTFSKRVSNQRRLRAPEDFFDPPLRPDAAVVRPAFLAAPLRAPPFAPAALRAPPLRDITISLSAFAGKNLNTRFAGTFTGSPVAGLRAMRAARSRTLNCPNPGIFTASPEHTAA